MTAEVIPTEHADPSETDSVDIGYTVTVESFSGPLDLLLYLVRRAEVDIIDIPITLIADQFIATVSAWADLDLDVAGEFILMAASLLEIKARLIAPPLAGTEDDESDDEIVDLRTGLIGKLLAYRRFKEAGIMLGARADEQCLHATRQLREDIPEDPTEAEGIDLENADPYALASSWELVLKRINGLGPRTVISDNSPLEVRITTLIDAVRSNGTAKLSWLFAADPSHLARVTTVMAVLECSRQRFLEALQFEQYADVDLRFRPEDERTITRIDFPPEESQRRRRRPPLATWQPHPDAVLGSDEAEGDDEPQETDEQRFMRELEEVCAVDAVLAVTADIERSFAAFLAERRGEPLPVAVAVAVDPAPVGAVAASSPQQAVERAAMPASVDPIAIASPAPASALDAIAPPTPTVEAEPVVASLAEPVPQSLPIALEVASAAGIHGVAEVQPAKPSAPIAAPVSVVEPAQPTVVTVVTVVEAAVDPVPASASDAAAPVDAVMDGSESTSAALAGQRALPLTVDVVEAEPIPPAAVDVPSAQAVDQVEVDPPIALPPLAEVQGAIAAEFPTIRDHSPAAIVEPVPSDQSAMTADLARDAAPPMAPAPAAVSSVANEPEPEPELEPKLQLKPEPETEPETEPEPDDEPQTAIAPVILTALPPQPLSHAANVIRAPLREATVATESDDGVPSRILPRIPPANPSRHRILPLVATLTAITVLGMWHYTRTRPALVAPALAVDAPVEAVITSATVAEPSAPAVPAVDPQTTKMSQVPMLLAWSERLSLADAYPDLVSWCAAAFGDGDLPAFAPPVRMELDFTQAAAPIVVDPAPDVPAPPPPTAPLSSLSEWCSRLAAATDLLGFADAMRDVPRPMTLTPSEIGPPADSSLPEPAPATPDVVDAQPTAPVPAFPYQSAAMMSPAAWAVLWAWNDEAPIAP
ncbi:MAG: segregation/condensation protein A [Planctomycetes bacterium]|nr:segregation/condensation protein A [Planctomycetota bacterium]